MSEAGNLLAAGSLILAVLAVLYSIWYPDAQSALNADLPPHYEDALPQLEQIRRVLEQEIVPLLATSLATTLIFLPKAIGVVIGTGNDLQLRSGPSNVGLRSGRDSLPVCANCVPEPPAPNQAALSRSP
jgi:hypothetical protein